MSETAENPLGAYLKDRRAKLDPAALGFPPSRRRTQGLRREEVASRANISPTWYTWLEQGRGGAPSADALNPLPAMIRTALWDVLAWNKAAGVLLIDYASMPPNERNILRYIFLDPRAHAAQYDWESVARFALGSFRVEAARAGAAAEIEPLVAELSRRSPDFKRLWEDNVVQGPPGEKVKHIRHPLLVTLAFEYSAFGVDGRTDLSMVIYNPATDGDAEKIKSLL